jgi:hypothetical protein
VTTKHKGPLIALLAALAIVAVALPGWAAKPITKIYSISVTPSSGVASGTSVVFTVTLTNVSPGNSSFNSFQLSAPALPNPGFVITQAVLGSGNSNPNASAVIQRTSGTVSVTTLDPVKPSQKVVLNVTATTPANTGCDAVGFGTWTATVWSGSALTGDVFNLTGTASGTTGTLAANCSSLDVSTYEDANVNSSKEISESNVGGFTIDLKQGLTVVATTTTAASGTGVGTASFASVAPGAYDVCERSRSGWTITDPATVRGTDACRSVTVPTANPVVFGNAADATITVTKYEDPNFNGVLDTGEGVLSGWKFQLKDGDGAAIGTEQSTGELGQIMYTVPAGNAYSVCETDPRSDPSSGTYAADPWVNTIPGGDRCTDVPALSVGSGASVGRTFRNAQGTLGCDAGNNSDTQSGGGTDATLNRLPNSDNSACILVPYSLTATQDTVTFTKDLTTQPFATFQLGITWGVAAKQYPNFGTTTFDLDGNFTTTQNDQFTPNNCTVVEGVAKPPKNPDTEGNYWPLGNAEQPWCLASTTVGPIPGGSDMQVTETFLGSGDPSILRK